jgi:hypothetical protein
LVVVTVVVLNKEQTQAVLEVQEAVLVLVAVAVQEQQDKVITEGVLQVHQAVAVAVQRVVVDLVVVVALRHQLQDLA